MHRLAVGVLSVSLTFIAPVLRSETLYPGASTTSSSYGQKIVVAGIHNFGKINDQLYRGAQPHDGDVEQLKKLGITTIVNLRREDFSQRNREKREAEALGIQFVSLPVSGWNAPADDQVATFLKIVSDPSQKVFVHCHFGEDRTGVFVAAYRIATQRWSAERAIDEMRIFGFNEFWHPAMTAYVRHFSTVFSSSPVFVGLRDTIPALSAIIQQTN